MSFRDDPQKLGDVLRDYLRKSGMEQPVDRARAIDAWSEVAGPHVIAVTTSVWMDRGRLFVKISSATWRQELHLQRTLWKTRLNDHLGKEVVKEIVFR